MVLVRELWGLDPNAVGRIVGLDSKRAAGHLVTRSVVGSPRDLSVLRSLAWARYLSTTQIERLHFPSRRTTQRRLRALRTHGLVRDHRQGVALHLDHVHALTQDGVARLAEAGTANARSGRVARLPKLSHGLAVRDLFVGFALAEQLGSFELRDFRFEEDLAGEPMFREARLIPDALAIVRRQGVTLLVGCEVDLGTETTTTLRAKLTAWRGLMGSRSHRDFSLLTAVARAERRRTLERLLAEVGCEGVVVELGGLAAAPVATLSCLFAAPVRAERTGAEEKAEEFQPVGTTPPPASRGW